MIKENNNIDTNFHIFKLWCKLNYIILYIVFNSIFMSYMSFLGHDQSTKEH